LLLEFLTSATAIYDVAGRRIALLDRAMEHSRQERNSRAARRPGLGQVGFSAVLSQREECGSDKWMKASPYLTIGATEWCISKGVVIVGYDFYHGNDEPGAPRVFHNSRTLSEHGVITMPYLKNLDRITKDRVTLIGFPLNIIGAEASPVRAVVLL